MLKIIQLIIILSLVTSFASAEILSQWRGPNRDGIYPGESLMKKWPKSGPKLLWSAEGLGIGFSSPAVTTDRVFVTSLFDSRGILFAFDHQGNLQWRVDYGPEWDAGHKGTRTTPTIVDDKIYLISGVGEVYCLDTNGKLLWSLDMKKKFGAKVLHWGIAESPLVDGDVVYCTPGGSSALVAALNRHSGNIIWQTPGDGEMSAYCSPRFILHRGKKILVTMTEKSLVAINPQSGALLWKQPHVTQYDINPNTPLYKDDLIYSFSGYGTGSQMFKITADGKSATKVWANDTPDNQMAGAVLINGYIYTSGHKNRGWGCLDWKTGKLKWQSRDYGGKGPIIFSDGMLFMYSEKGDVVLAKPDPERFEPVSAFKMEKGSGPHWAHPVVKKGRLYIRHGDVLHVYDVAAK